MYIFMFSFQEFGSEEFTSIADKVVNEVRECMWIKLTSFAHVIYMLHWLCILQFHAQPTHFEFTPAKSFFYKCAYMLHTVKILKKKKSGIYVIQNGHSMCVCLFHAV